MLEVHKNLSKCFKLSSFVVLVGACSISWMNKFDEYLIDKAFLNILFLLYLLIKILNPAHYCIHF